MYNVIGSFILEEFLDFNILTVTQLNEFVKLIFDNTYELQKIRIRGEISNFTNHIKSGHFYFSLKDSTSAIKAVMFSSESRKLKFVPENGMKVVAQGRVSTFVRDGVYQFYAESLEPDGLGALYLAYEQLKKKLEAEGLFSEKYKKQIPEFPEKIGVITSPTGAVIKDIINVTKRQYPLAQIFLYPALVQGEGAEKTLVSGIEYFSETKSADVIIIGRGGGSIEDLWCFNSESLARAIAECPIPVISAVGHETDFTICDFVASKRAPTPSAAAELAVPSAAELSARVASMDRAIRKTLTDKINLNRDAVLKISNKNVMKSPRYFLDERQQALMSLTRHLENGWRFSFQGCKNNFLTSAEKLNMLNPLSIITRGYSTVFKEDGTLIKSVKQIDEGEKFRFKISDGEVLGQVLQIKENKSDENTER